MQPSQDQQVGIEHAGEAKNLVDANGRKEFSRASKKETTILLSGAGGKLLLCIVLKTG